MPKTRAQIAAEIAANLPDNSSGAITPTLVRSTLTDIAAAAPNIADDQPTAIAAGGTGAATAIAALDSLITPEASVASATTTNLGAATTRNVLITGTTTITSFGTVAAGVMRYGRFTGILTLTHNATSLILPNAGSNITTAAGDRFASLSLGGGNWLVYAYQRADGTALVGGGGGIPYANDAFIIVQTTSNATTNGTALIAAYAAAKALTPNGSALSATNRSVVLIPPGVYSLGTTQLALDTQFVDLVGLSTNKSDARITSAVVASNGGTIRQTVSDVALENLTIDNTASTRSANDATDASAYAPNGSLSATRITNCEFKDGGGASWCMRQSVTYSGMYQFCVCADYSFGGHGGSFGGTGQNCTVGAHSFADNATMMGTVTDCVASSASFGGGNSGLLTGLAFRCTAGSGSFGSGGLSGFVQNCKASDNSFAGAAGIFSGTAIDCEGAAHCFAAFGGTFSGRAFDCTALNDSFGGDAATVSGIIESCIAGNGSFGHAGTFSGSLTDCRLLNANDVTYPQTWTAWNHAWAPIAFTGRVTGMRFAPTGSDLDAVILPDGTDSGSFEFCSFLPTGTGLAVAISGDGSAELRLEFCSYNGAEVADGLTNDFSIEGAAIGQVQRRDGGFASLVVAGSTTLRTTSARLLRINSTGAAVNEYLQDLFNIRATLDFGSISASASADLTITVTGAVVGDTVALGLPAAPAAGIIFQCFVSATNTVTVRATNITAISVDPASAEYQVTVFKFLDAS